MKIHVGVRQASSWIERAQEGCLGKFPYGMLEIPMSSRRGRITQMARALEKLGIALTLAAIALSSGTAQSQRTVYEIYVREAGKSSGLRAVLHDDRGQLALEGADVQTPIGSFNWVSCRMLWDSCGRWRAGSSPPRISNGRQHPSVLCYRITREEPGGETHWRGELGEPAREFDRSRLWLSNVCVRPISDATDPTARIETRMGVFRWTSGRIGTAQWQGWVPQDWPDLPLTQTGQHTGN